MLLQRKNDSRDASVEIADAIALAGGARGGLGFAAIDELRIRQQAPQRRFDAVIEVPASLRPR